MAALIQGPLIWEGSPHCPQLPLWEGDKLFFRLLEEDAPFFSMKLRYEGERLVYAALNGKPLPLSLND